MNGCCAGAGQKFVDKSGAVDKVRLGAAIEGVREGGLSQDELILIGQKIERCKCACHVDGINCLC